jgi:hypothetical protein
MITANNTYKLVEGSAITFGSDTKIECQPLYLSVRGLFSVTIIAQNGTTDLEDYRGFIDLTKTEVDAETGTGTGETDPWFKALQEAVITKLEAITGNGGVTFTASV